MKKKCIKCLDLVSVKTRLEIIQQLRKGPQNASQINDCFALTQPTISYHLSVLKKAGMIKAKKEGRGIYYWLNQKYPCKNCIVKNV